MARRYRFDVSSVTNAMRGRSLLERNGLRAAIERKLDPAGNNGCGYSLLVSADPDQVTRLLQAGGIRVQRWRAEEEKR